MPKRRGPAGKKGAKDAPRVAVVAHSGKTFAGGLSELHGALAAAGIPDPLWFEVDKSRKGSKKAKKAIKQGAELIFVWGGDGMVQRCVDAVAGKKVPLAIVPAGTANLLASNLGVPKDIPAAVEIGLHGTRRTLDVGKVNGERFAVMAGIGFDALMIRDADRGLKARFGRLAYVWTGIKQVRKHRVDVRIKVDDEPWFKGRAACVLMGNVGTAFGGVTLFENAKLDDGRLELGVVTASGAMDWLRTIVRTVVRAPGRSPFLKFTSGRKIGVKLAREVDYELDGSVRPATKELRISIEPSAIQICVPKGMVPKEDQP